ncbi:MAG: FtsX-like permease family protein [Sphaerochaetaceae bacterium]|nr:FtsX-like permease family protein [Sphaerochaetaceae bacterium]MDC7248702.1 FtsX-like permease family protein [Sphaerochaetaceae bacterium]
MIYKIARRYAFSSKNRHKLTSIRITIGLLFATLALNVILAFMVGLQDKKFSLIREYDSYDAIIDLNETTDVSQLLNKLNTNNNIDFAFEFIEVPTIIRDYNNGEFFGKIRGFKQSDFNKLSYSLIKGDYDKNGIMIGYSKTLTSSFSYMDNVKVTILKKGKTVTVVPLELEKIISGVYYTPVGDFNNYYAFMDYDSLKQYAPYTLSKVGVYGDIETIREVASDYGVVNSWIDQNESLYAAMKLEQYLMYLTLSLLSFIVLFQLHNSTINLIKTKEGEIAMLRALGITKNQTKRIFALSSLIVSGLGIIIGSSLSFLILTNYTQITSILNRITNYSIPLLSINVELDFSLSNCIMIALPLIIITYIMSQIAIKKLLNKNNLEILLNE